MTDVEQPKTDQRLSTVSAKYDRGQKGYLDSKEMLARELDDGNG